MATPGKELATPGKELARDRKEWLVLVSDDARLCALEGLLGQHALDFKTK